MSFSEIVGHQAAVRILQNSLREKRLGVSYLFYGPSGVGKSFVAKQFAKSLFCELQDGDCCNRCQSCLQAEKLVYPDLHWLDLQEGSQNIKIEQIRQMQEAISLRPFQARAKVFIINNCQTLTEEASHCLLKALEEPPLDSVIILITVSLHLIVPTIVSRCQKVKFSTIKRQELKMLLEKDYSLDPKESRLLSYYLDGRIGDALSLAQSGFLGERDSILGTYINARDTNGFEELFREKAMAEQVLSVFMSWFRDVLLVKLLLPQESLINQDRVVEIEKEAGKYTSAQLFLILDTLAKGFEYLKNNVNMRLLADSIMVNLTWKN